MKKTEAGVFENRVKRLVSGLKFVTSTQIRKISDEDKQVLKEAMAVCNRLLAEPQPDPIIPIESAITLTATTSLLRAGTLALDWLRQLPVFIDTETTGFEGFAQVIELAITDASGNVLFESKLRPTVTINPRAQEVHGIKLSSLKSAPTWPQVAEKVRSLLDGRKIIAYNAPFDSRMMKQTAAAFGDPLGWWSDNNVLCAMTLAVDAFDIPKRTLKLSDAMVYAELPWQGKAHTARADTQAMARLVSAISTFGKSRESDVAISFVPPSGSEPPTSPDADSPYGDVYSDAMQHMKSITGRQW